MRTLLQAGQAAGGDGSSGASQSPATAAAAGKEITPEVLDLVRTSESDVKLSKVIYIIEINYFIRNFKLI
jgi:hypothetical protein